MDHFTDKQIESMEEDLASGMAHTRMTEAAKAKKQREKALAQLRIMNAIRKHETNRGY